MIGVHQLRTSAEADLMLHLFLVFVILCSCQERGNREAVSVVRSATKKTPTPSISDSKVSRSTLKASVSVSCALEEEDTGIRCYLMISIRNSESYPIAFLPNNIRIRTLFSRDENLWHDTSPLAFEMMLHEDSVYKPTFEIFEPKTSNGSSKDQGDFVMIPPRREVLVTIVHRDTAVILEDAMKLRHLSGDGYVPLWPLNESSNTSLLRNHLASQTYKRHYTLDARTRHVINSTSSATPISVTEFNELSNTVHRPVKPVQYKSRVKILGRRRELRKSERISVMRQQTSR